MNNSVSLTIDGVEIKAKHGSNLLWTAIDHGFYVPTLCSIRGSNIPLASCRLCFVEIDGIKIPVTSCTQRVYDGMNVHLNTERVKRIRQTAFELLLSHHKLDCSDCVKNQKCELQNIAKKLGLKLKLERIRQIPRDTPIDYSHPLFYFDANKCVICGKCIWVCKEKGEGIFTFSFRGIKTAVSNFYSLPMAESKCSSCLECVRICPVAALVEKTEHTFHSIQASGPISGTNRQ